MFTVFQVRKMRSEDESWLYRTDYYIRNRRLARKHICMDMENPKRHDFLKKTEKGARIPAWFKEERDVSFGLIDRIFAQDFTELKDFNPDKILKLIKDLKEGEKLNIIIRR
ncbi:MAG: hypothetical protein ACRCYT_06920 [Cetobacterium sp.]